jgi:deoxyribodipyrimidine photo-lyase
MTKPIIYWFRNDLRLHDNAPLTKAIETGAPLLPVYILDDVWIGESGLGFPRTGEFRLQFLYESLADLSLNLERAGTKLLVFKGDTISILKSLTKETEATAIYAQSEFAFEELQIQKALTEFIPLNLYPGSMLFTPDTVPFSIEKSPFYYTAFKNKLWDVGKMVETLPAIQHISGFNSIARLNLPELFAIPYNRTEGLFKGGETKGLKRLETYTASGAPFRYSTTRNQLEGNDFSSLLSPWLANGCLSVRRVWRKFSELKPEDETGEESLRTLKEQLIWRDYFRFLMMRYGEKLFWIKGLRISEPTMFNDHETFMKWCVGETGQPIVDALMRELKGTGFMSNRGRMLVSYYLAKELKVNWQWGASWFESMLVDYDVYSNYGNWAYQSGRGTDSRVNRRFNLVKQAEKFDADSRFRRKWLND